MIEFSAILDTIIRSILAIIALEVLARINGAKQISQLTFYDYITGITIGSMAAVMAIDDQIPFWLPLVSIVVFVFASYLEGKWTMHSLQARKLIEGTPMILMANGKLLQSHMYKAHLTVNDLLSEARVAGYFNLHDIAFAIMENSGKISFLPYAETLPANRKDLQITGNTSSLYVNVVIDGELLERTSNGFYIVVKNFIMETMSICCWQLQIVTITYTYIINMKKVIIIKKLIIQTKMDVSLP